MMAVNNVRSVISSVFFVCLFVFLFFFVIISFLHAAVKDCFDSPSQITRQTYICNIKQSGTDSELRHRNTEESVLYYIREYHNDFTLLLYRSDLDPRMIITSQDKLVSSYHSSSAELV